MQFEKKILNYILLNLKSKIDKENQKVHPNIAYVSKRRKKIILLLSMTSKLKK